MRALLVCAIAVAAPVAAQDSLPPVTLQALKAATVFVKVEADTGNATGSGFVIRSDGDTVIVLTNHHVITAEPDKANPAKAVRPARVSLVFGSGTGAERTVPAIVLAKDKVRDLAVLSARGVVNPPAPIDIRPAPQIIETMSAFTFGFPFGQKLALGQPTPAVTVGKASVSSLRLERGVLRFVQLEGELNPGNSGGPVVDVAGRLIGVAVGKVQDTRIAVAIARPQVEAILRPQVSRATIFLAEAKGGTEVGFEVRLFDPMGVVRSASLGIARKNALQGGEEFAKAAGHKLLPLQLSGAVATGRFGSTTPVAEEDFPFAWQVVLTDADGRTVASDPLKPPPTSFRRGPLRVESSRRALTDAEFAAVVADVPVKELTKSVSALRRLALAATTPGQRTDAIAVLLPAITAESSLVRLEAAKALRTWAGRDAVPQFAALLKDDAVDVRFAVLDLLAELRDPRSAEAVAGCLERDREKATATIRAIGRPAATALHPLLKTKSLALRVDVCKLLREIGGPESREALQAASRDADPLVAQFATEALQAVTGRR